MAQCVTYNIFGDEVANNSGEDQGIGTADGD